MSYKNLLLTKSNNIATVKINNPETLNALNSGVLQELNKVFDDLITDQTIRAVILTGEGRAFVAGADIKEMIDLNEINGSSFGNFGSMVFRKIEVFPKPIIAAINGFALGGGCELAMACDIRLASDKAKFGQPEVGLGITPGFSGTQRLPRLVGMGIAKEMIYTGKVIDANEALRIGLVNAVVAQDELIAEAIKMAEKIAKNAPFAVQASKEAIDRGIDMDIDKAILMESYYFGQCFGTEDQKNGMKAFVKKEKINFEGK